MWYFARSFGVKAGTGCTFRERVRLEVCQMERDFGFNAGNELTKDPEENSRDRGELSSIYDNEH